MNLTRLALSNPVAVIAAILLVALMGTIAMLSLPIQMIPDVQRPFIQISTGWRTAAPEEVESEIIEPQEDVLRGIPGLEKNGILSRPWQRQRQSAIRRRH